jgi:hypothetical protein
MEPGFVYLMQAEGADGYLQYQPVKIGKSFSPLRREKDFSGYPTRVRLVHKITTNDMGWLEAKLHRQYDSRRMSGEWFDLQERDLQALQRLAVVDRVPDGDFSLYTEEQAEAADPSPGLWADLPGEDFGSHPVVEKVRAALVSAGWKVTDQAVQDLFSHYWLVTGLCRGNVICRVCHTRVEAWRRAHQRVAVVGMLEPASPKEG